MALFSLLTIFNIKGQLSRMLLLQVIAYRLFTLPIGVIIISMPLVLSMRTSFMQGLGMIFTMWQKCIFFLSFLIRLFKQIHIRED
jgi:hypothetical protein